MRRTVTKRNNLFFRLFPFLCMAYFIIVGSGLLFTFGFKFLSHDLLTAMSDIELRANDFTLRMNECACVRAGCDPYKVSLGDQMCPPFGGDRAQVERGVKYSHPCADVGGYPPWEYTLLMPLSFLPRWVAWIVYASFVGLLWLTICFFVFRLCCREMPRSYALIPACLLIYPAWFDWSVGNLNTCILGALLLMVYSLNSQRTVLAGLCLTFAMVKPQLGALFVVPLLMRKQFLVVFIAAVTCVLLTLPAAFLSNTSPIELILNIPAYGATGFRPPATCPGVLADIISKAIGQYGVMIFGVLVGVAVCIWLSYIGRRSTDWLWYLAPTFLLATSWSYALDHAYVMGCVPMVFLLGAMVKTKCNLTRIVSLVSVLLLARPLNLICFIGITCSGALPWLKMPTQIDRLFNSVCGFIVLISFVFVYYRVVSVERMENHDE